MRALLEKHVDSFDKLEIVLILAETPGQAIARATLVERLGLPADELSSCIHELSSSGLLVETEDSVGPANAAAVQAVDLLARAYREDSLALMQMLSAIAMARIRGMAARVFASAFELRPGKKGKTDD